MKRLTTIMLSCLTIFVVNSQLIKNDFLTGYAVNVDLEKGAYSSTTQGEGNPIMINQWNFSGKTGPNDQSGVNPKTVDPLYYTDYIQSGEDVAIEMLKLETGGRTSIYSLADNSDTYGAGTYYLALMLNASTASLTSTADFVSFDGNYTGNAQRARLTIKGIDEVNYQLGLGDAGVATTFSATNLNFDQTHLIVIKVTLIGDGTGTSWLYINPAISETEPASHDATTGITGTALKGIRGIVIRQRSAYAAHIGGFRLAKSWASVLGFTTGLSNTRDNHNIYVKDNSIITGIAGKLKVYSLSGAELVSTITEGQYLTKLSTGNYLVRFTDVNGVVSSTKLQIK